MKISKNFDFPEEKIYTEQDETNLFNDENENISDKIITNTVDEFEPKVAEEMEVEDKIEKDNFLDEALKFIQAETNLSKQKEQNLVDDITDEKALDDI